MSAADDIATYLAYLKTGGNHIDQIIFDELPNGEEMTDTLQNVVILMMCIAFIVHALGGDHGEHWFAFDTLARMYEELERRVRDLERRDA